MDAAAAHAQLGAACLPSGRHLAPGRVLCPNPRPARSDPAAPTALRPLREGKGGRSGAAQGAALLLWVAGWLAEGREDGAGGRAG